MTENKANKKLVREKVKMLAEEYTCWVAVRSDHEVLAKRFVKLVMEELEPLFR